MTLDSQIAELDRSIADNTKAVELAKALERLESNRDFRKIIADGYFREEAVRLVHLKADPVMQTPEKQASIIRQMDSIGNLTDYFNTVRQKGVMSANTITDCETDRDALLNEVNNG